MHHAQDPRPHRSSRAHFLGTVALASLLAEVPSLAAQAATDLSATLTKSQRDALTPAQVLAAMKQGNQRFQSGAMTARNLIAQAQANNLDLAAAEWEGDLRERRRSRLACSEAPAHSHLAMTAARSIASPQKRDSTDQLGRGYLAPEGTSFGGMVGAPLRRFRSELVITSPPVGATESKSNLTA